MSSTLDIHKHAALPKVPTSEESNEPKARWVKVKHNEVLCLRSVSLVGPKIKMNKPISEVDKLMSSGNSPVFLGTVNRRVYKTRGLNDRNVDGDCAGIFFQIRKCK